MKRVSPGTCTVTGGPLKVAFALQGLIEQKERAGDGLRDLSGRQPT
jgi:hypothetical protein